MNDTQERVARCFANVFPNIEPDQIQGASDTSLPAWDSLAQVRLIAAIEEEFGLQLDMDAFEELVSYRLICDHLERISTRS